MSSAPLAGRVDVIEKTLADETAYQAFVNDRGTDSAKSDNSDLNIGDHDTVADERDCAFESDGGSDHPCNGQTAGITVSANTSHVTMTTAPRRQ